VDEQLSYHNNHIPYVATANVKADCAAGKTCKPVSPSAGNAAADYTSMQASTGVPPAIQCLDDSVSDREVLSCFETDSMYLLVPLISGVGLIGLFSSWISTGD
jgi:hypothetical protein